MGTGYMGADEPEIVPRGMPSQQEASEKTLTNFNQPQQEQTETPAPKEETPPPAAAETKEPEPRVVEKIVEKIVEKYPEFKDENSKALYEAWTEGRMDDVKSYWREMDKNYDTMSHIDVIREGISKKNPNWSKDEVELELRGVYGKQLEKYDMSLFDKDVDPDGYDKAQLHNERADENQLKLERDARDFRHALKEGQKTVELPKIKKEPEQATPQQSNQYTPEQIEQAKRDWASAAEEQVKDLADFKFNVGDDKDPEEVIYALSPEDKAAITETMKKWDGNDFMARRQWQKPDGSFDLKKIAEDEQILKDHEKMVKSAYTQGVTTGRKQEVARIKNVDFEQNRISDAPGKAQDASELVWG